MYFEEAMAVLVEDPKRCLQFLQKEYTGHKPSLSELCTTVNAFAGRYGYTRPFQDGEYNLFSFLKANRDGIEIESR